MELVQIKIKRLTVTQRYGALTAGDLLRTDAAFARHLVEDCAAAEYTTQQKQAEQPATEPPKRTRKPKAEK